MDKKFFQLFTLVIVLCNGHSANAQTCTTHNDCTTYQNGQCDGPCKEDGLSHCKYCFATSWGKLDCDGGCPKHHKPVITKKSAQPKKQ